MKAHFLKTGNFTDGNGQKVTFTPENMAYMAESYDPSKHKAPVVAGHPQHNHPALGWVNSIEQTDKGLVANADISPDLAQAFEDGHYKNVSASLYQPNDPNNPTPGVLSLKHLGVLGATAPVIKGLEAVQLAEGGETVPLMIMLAESPANTETPDTKETEAKDSTPPPPDKKLANKKTEADSDLSDSKQNATPNDLVEHLDAGVDIATQEAKLKQRQAELDKEAAELDKKAAELKAQREELARREQKLLKGEVNLAEQGWQQKIDGLVNSGILPAQKKDALLGICRDLATQNQPLALSEATVAGDTATKPPDNISALLELLGDRSHAPLTFGEISAQSGNSRLSSENTGVEIANKLTEEMSRAEKNGQVIDAAQALQNLKTNEANPKGANL